MKTREKIKAHRSYDSSSSQEIKNDESKNARKTISQDNNDGEDNDEKEFLFED